MSLHDERLFASGVMENSIVKIIIWQMLARTNMMVKISGNVLVLGSMKSGKTSLVQQLGCNGMFWELRKVNWISKVDLSNRRDAEIESYFSAEEEFYINLKKNTN